MILFFCAVWFTVLYYVGYKKFGSKDSFGPVKLLTTKMILMNVPFLYFIALYPEKFNENILKVINLSLPDALLNYTVIQTISYIFLLIGIKSGRKNYTATKVKLVKIYRKVSIYNVLSFSFFIVGTYFYFKFINSVGGLYFLLANLSQRTEFLNTGNEISYTVFFLTVSALLLIFSYSRKKSSHKVFLIILYVSLIIFIFSTTGGRKNTLYLIIFLTAAFNYYIRPFKLRNIKKIYVIGAAALLSFYILAVPLLRAKDGFENIQNNEINLVDILQIEDLINSISYTYIDVFSANFYNTQNFWYFSGFNDILLNLSSLPKDLKPPIDDGVYFRSTVEYNKDFKPSVARSMMYESSWPIEHFGFAMANLGIIGIIIFSYILGYIYSKFYRLMLVNNIEPVFLYLYVFVVFNFNFSNLRIVQFIGFLPFIIFYIFLNKFIQKR